MQLVLSINLGNEAMQTPEDVAMALINSARAIQHHDEMNCKAAHIVCDRNGNTVGKWEVIEETPAATKAANENTSSALRFKGDSVSCALCGLYMRVIGKSGSDVKIAIHPKDECENSGKRVEFTVEGIIREAKAGERLSAPMLYQVDFVDGDGQQDGSWLVSSDLVSDELEDHITGVLNDGYWGEFEVSAPPVISLAQLDAEIKENLVLEDDED